MTKEDSRIERIKYAPYRERIITAEQAALLIHDQAVVGASGFTKAGDSKSVLPAFAQRAAKENVAITLITGASLGQTTDADLATNNALIRRMPFQADAVLRKTINSGQVKYIDQHLSETIEQLQEKHIPQVEIAIIEATYINEEGFIIPTTSIGNSAYFASVAKKIIIEVNTAIPLSIEGIHDNCVPKKQPRREIIPIHTVEDKIGESFIRLNPENVVGVVFSSIEDTPALLPEPDHKTSAISQHLLNFFEEEVKKGKLTYALLPLQAGIGKVANAVLTGFKHGPFENLTMYSEVLQDSTFDLIDAGKMTFASGSSITVTEECYNRLLENFDQYKDKLVLRPQNISNAPEVIRRLGIIAINTAIEFDIYGNVNSTHIGGNKMMNGIGGSGDFARNAYLSIFVTQAASKDNNVISHVLPMVSHVDHTEHDVDILVTDIGLADLRGLSPRERAEVIIENCAHPDYRDELRDYFDRAVKEVGGHTPHILEEAYKFHIRFKNTGSMKS
ncbi:succinate CoA transferase [Myroides albus]|uniref:Succinate CoA transferase n=1 Tax=Myroides albus TaxID=2562892 RepID=A0A6I3LJL2_9FLAO|nr:succinate CoA transferase [Myroides albus]MTG97766.1 succinate CoA transferase [Myroides albus]UVD79707.1 succinate CoA transferase [Myroides albus]UVD79722.1 succinate CoA transferase [Myroides albus]